MRLINGDRLLMKLKQHRLLFIKAFGDFSNFSEKDKARIDEIDNCIAEIINAPTIDPEDLRPKGRWEDCEGNQVPFEAEKYDSRCPDRSAYCSECGEMLTASDEYSCVGNYCPNCGADMRGGK